MNHHFLLEVSKSKVFLTLKKEDEVLEKMLVGDGYSLAEKLLPAIDDMLRKNDLEPKDIEVFEVASDLPEGYSSRRIAETTASIFGFAIS